MRLNRFVVEAVDGGDAFFLSLNNTGRLEDFLRQGRRAFFLPHENRKTRGKLVGVEVEGGLALLDTALQMKAFEAAFSRGLLPWLSSWRHYRRNPRLGKSVLDYLFMGDGKDAYLELKSAVYRRDNLALYPDAPTERGRRHLRVLIDLQRQGFVAYVVFVVALPGVVGFAPFKERDQEVAELVHKARQEGVIVRSLHLSLTEDGWLFLHDANFPVILE